MKRRWQIKKRREPHPGKVVIPKFAEDQSLPEFLANGRRRPCSGIILPGGPRLCYYKLTDPATGAITYTWTLLAAYADQEILKSTYAYKRHVDAQIAALRAIKQFDAAIRAQDETTYHHPRGLPLYQKPPKVRRPRRHRADRTGPPDGGPPDVPPGPDRSE